MVEIGGGNGGMGCAGRAGETDWPRGAEEVPWLVVFPEGPGDGKECLFCGYVTPAYGVSSKRGHVP